MFMMVLDTGGVGPDQISWIQDFKLFILVEDDNLFRRDEPRGPVCKWLPELFINLVGKTVSFLLLRSLSPKTHTRSGVLASTPKPG